jgi:hypothetical protein
MEQPPPNGAARWASALLAAPFAACGAAFVVWLLCAGPSYYWHEFWWRSWPAHIHFGCTDAVLAGACPANRALAWSLASFWLLPAAAALSATALLAARAALAATRGGPAFARRRRAAAVWAGRLVPPPPRSRCGDAPHALWLAALGAGRGLKHRTLEPPGLDTSRGLLRPFARCQQAPGTLMTRDTRPPPPPSRASCPLRAAARPARAGGPSPASPSQTPRSSPHGP